MKFEDCVNTILFRQESAWVRRCYNIRNQEPTGEARINERDLLVVSFLVADASPIPFRGLIDTGSGVSILTFAAFNRVTVKTRAMLRPLISLVCGEIKTVAMAEHIHF